MSAEESMTSESLSLSPIRSTYKSVQGAARGPGVEEWRQVDRARSDLTELYRSLSEDDRYAPEYA
jgi:hypothetical protein